MPNLKILHIVPSYKPAYVYGGPIESVARLCEGLVQAGHHVQVFTTTANGKAELDVKPGKNCKVDGVNVIYFKRITKDHTHISPALWKQLYRECRAYDIIHVHSWWNILVIIATLICVRKKAKVILSPRGMLSDYIIRGSNSKIKSAIHTFLGKSLLKKTIFHATAEAEYNECKQIIPEWKGFVIPNVLWLPKLEVRKTENNVFTLLFMSRIHPKKGIELLFDAISQINYRVQLEIAGSGDAAYISKLHERIEQLGITKRIKWIGWKSREDKFEALMKADLFVLTSYNENFANVVVESLHVGTPILVSDQVGLAVFVEKHNLGWVTTLSPKQIKNTIEIIIMDKEKTIRINREGRQHIETFFSQRVLISKYITAYQESLTN